MYQLFRQAKRNGGDTSPHPCETGEDKWLWSFHLEMQVRCKKKMISLLLLLPPEIEDDGNESHYCDDGQIPDQDHCRSCFRGGSRHGIPG